MANKSPYRRNNILWYLDVVYSDHAWPFNYIKLDKLPHSLQGPLQGPHISTTSCMPAWPFHLQVAFQLPNCHSLLCFPLPGPQTSQLYASQGISAVSLDDSIVSISPVDSADPIQLLVLYALWSSMSLKFQIKDSLPGPRQTRIIPQPFHQGRGIRQDHPSPKW